MEGESKREVESEKKESGRITEKHDDEHKVKT